MSDKKILVCYSDGSSRPNPGYAGYGNFGYLLAPSKKPKSINFMLATNVVFTPYGLMEKSHITITDKEIDFMEEALGKDIGPHQRKDLKVLFAEFSVPYETQTVITEIGSLPTDEGTNNQAELLGAIRVLERAVEKKDELERVLVICDSQYVLKGIRFSLKKWKSNYWKTTTGEPVKNIELWKRLDNAKETLESANVIVDTKWIKGHEDDHGNIIVDMLASIGTAYSNNQYERNADPFNELVYSEEVGVTQFKKELEVMHVSQFYKTLYFSTREIDVTGNNILLASPKVPEDVGKRNLDNSYGLLVNDPLRTYITAQTDFCQLVGEYNVRTALNLDAIKGNKLFSKIVDKIGLSDLLFNVKERGRNKMVMGDGKPIIEELGKSFGFIMDTINVYDTLEEGVYTIEHLDRGVGNAIDITDHFITNVAELDHSEPKIELAIKFSDSSIDLGDEIELPHHILISNPVLYIGKDTPPYAVFKHLGNRIQSVHLVTKEGSESNLSTFIVVVKFLNDNNDVAYIAHTNIEGKFLVKEKPITVTE